MAAVSSSSASTILAEGGMDLNAGMGLYLRRRFSLFLAGLALMSFVAYALFMVMISGQDSLAGQVNDIGRQRMLAMRIASTVALAHEYRGADGLWRLAVARDLAAMKATFETLPQRARETRTYEAVQAGLEGEPYHLMVVFRRFSAAVEGVVSGAPPTAQRRRELMAMATGPLLQGIDALALSVEARSRDLMLGVSRLITGGEVLYVLLLIILGGRILWPLSRSVQANVDRIVGLESFQRSIVDGLPAGLLLLDRNRHQAEVLNPAARAVFGLTGEDGIVLLKDVLPALATVPEETLITWTRVETDGMRKDGTPMHMEATVRRVAAGQLVAMLRDVTEERENEARIQSFYDVLEQAPVSIVITDSSGVIEYVNPRFSAITGYSADEVIGKTPRILKSGRTTPEVYQQLWASLKQGQQWRCEIQNQRKNGEIYWEFQAISPLRDSRGRIVQFLAVKEDISAQKEWQASLIHAMEEARRANQAKSDFLAGMSHELRTPLNAIIGYSELMMLEARGPLGHPSYHSYLSAVHDSGQHLLKLINDLLDISKVDANKLELEECPVNVRDLLHESGAVVRERVDARRLDLQFEIEAGLPAILADPLRLKQILLNLLSNAIKFTPEGKRITVRVGVLGSGDFEMAVADDGCGIRDCDIARVLEPFAQVQDNPTIRPEIGTGLGLPLSRRLAELHGGSLNLSSVYGRGTVVQVLLPAARVLVTPGPVAVMTCPGRAAGRTG